MKRPTSEIVGESEPTSRTPPKTRSHYLISFGRAILGFFRLVRASIIDTLKLLNRWIELLIKAIIAPPSEATPCSPSITRWPERDVHWFKIVLGGFFVVFVVIIAANYFRLDKTTIELFLETTDLSFSAPEDIPTQNLVENLHLADIGFGEVSSVQVGMQEPVSPERPFPLKLTKERGTHPSLVLEQLNFPQASTLYLNVVPFSAPSDDAYTPLNRLLQLLPDRLARVNAMLVRCGPPIGSFEMPESVKPMAADCSYQLEIEINGAENIEVSSVEGLSITDGGLFASAATYRDSASILDFNFETIQERLKLGSQVKISAVSFMRVHEFNNENDPGYSFGSGIESGTLYLEDVKGEDLKGREIQLRSGEELSFKVVNGGLRTIELGEETMTVQFSGSVSDLRIGEHSLMPTRFAIEFAKDYVKALFAAVGTMTALALALGAWLLPRT